jgi:hypothetical protein
VITAPVGRSLLENRTYISDLFFGLYQVFLTLVQITTFVSVGGTHRYKYPLTGTRRGLFFPTRYKCLTFVTVVAPPGTNVLSSHLYQVGARPGINVGTFVLGKKKTRYKYHSIHRVGEQI